MHLLQLNLILSTIVLLNALISSHVERQERLRNAKPLNGAPLKVHSVSEFKKLVESEVPLHKLDIRGNLDQIKEIQDHPVIKLLHERKRQKSKQDGFKYAIAIEGGGMRGCVAAGMVTALWYLGLDDYVDVVYGSSAGSLVGAYFITKQLPYDGPQIYYKLLTSAGKQFIDEKQILRSCGLGLLDLRLSSLVKLATDRLGSPVLNLDFLLNEVVKTRSPLNWPKFWEMQNTQPLKIIASGLLSKSSVILSAAEGNFRNLDELASCLRASMLLPGVSGPPVQLVGDQIARSSVMTANWTAYNGRKKIFSFGSEPLLDAQLFEQIPFRSAIKENCSHILVFRTRADGINMTKRLSLVEKLMLRRYFRKKLKLPEVAEWMLKQKHKERYCEDILKLNEESRNFDESGQTPKICCIALPTGVEEVSRLEMSKKIVLENIREGFAVAYDRLVTDLSTGNGMTIAKKIWSDDLLREL